MIIGTQAAKSLFTFSFRPDRRRPARTRGASAGTEDASASWRDQRHGLRGLGDLQLRPSGNCFDSNTVRNDDFSANGCDTDYGAPPPAPPGGRT
jgi:hypothetical protein